MLKVLIFSTFLIFQLFLAPAMRWEWVFLLSLDIQIRLES